MKLWYEKIAERFGMMVNPNAEHRDLILEGLEQKKAAFKARYCPCLTERSKDTVCPCLKMRTEKVCHCMLFQKL
jgi:ferredoxin-thioredoxin reductase catalytic subunit